MDEAVKYIGEWQSKSVILEKLEGPTGEGRVEFPNGDSFEGYFYLHFARIQGPCYVAQGKYTFADGKYIENAWINTSSDLTMFGLKGVFEVRNADGSGTAFYDTARYAAPRGNYQVMEDARGSQWYAIRGEAAVDRRPVYENGHAVYDDGKLRTISVETVRYKQTPARFAEPQKRADIATKAPRRKQ